jgi:YidC/Oxa1 family membrane protein insertase
LLRQRTVSQAPSAWRSISISATSHTAPVMDASVAKATAHGSVPEMAATDCGGFNATTYSSETVQVAADAAGAASGGGGAAAAAAEGSVALDALPSVETVELVTEAMPYFRPYSPVTLMYNLLDTVHAVSGMPWWATVAVCTLTARTCLLPVIVYTMKNGAKMALMKPEMDAVQTRFKAEQRSDPGAQERFQRDAAALMTKYDVHPMRMLIGPLAQAPIFISFFMATRRLAEFNPDVATEGFFWVPSMAEADPLYILPACASVSMLIIAQLGGDTGNEQQAEQMEKFRKVMQIAAIGVFPLTYWMPSLTFCYWLSSNSFSCLQVPGMKQPAVKKFFGIPIVPTGGGGGTYYHQPRALVCAGLPASPHIHT